MGAHFFFPATMTSLMLPLTNQEVMDRLPFTDASMILSLRLSSLGQKIVRRILKEVKKNIKKHSAEATSDDMLQAYFWTFLCSNSTFEHALQLVQERHETKMENQRSRRKSAKVLYTGWLQHVYGSLLTLKIMKQNKQALPKSYECHTFIDLDSHLESHEDFWGTYVCDTVAKVRSYITAGRRLTVAALLQLGELIVAARDWYERSDPKGNSKFDTQFRSEKAKYETADMFLWKFSDVESVLNNIDQLDVVVEIYALSSKFPGIKFMDTSHDDLLRFWGKFRKELMEGSISEEDFGSPSFTLSAKRIAVVRKDSQDRLLKATANTSQALGSYDEEGSFSTRQEEETSAETEDCESSNSSSTEPPLTPMDSVSTALGRSLFRSQHSGRRPQPRVTTASRAMGLAMNPLLKSTRSRSLPTARRSQPDQQVPSLKGPLRSLQRSGRGMARSTLLRSGRRQIGGGLSPMPSVVGPRRRASAGMSAREDHPLLNTRPLLG